MARTPFSQKLVTEDPNFVCVYLRQGVEPVLQKQGEIILDVNRSGNWVHGFEMIGGFVPFSLEKAVLPFSPTRPPFPEVPESGTVTYDPEADAAYIYLEYNSSLAGLAPQEQVELKKISHSVNPTATYGLDDQGGLVWVKVPIADLSGSADQFLRLLRR